MLQKIIIMMKPSNNFSSGSRAKLLLKGKNIAALCFNGKPKIKMVF